MGQPVIITLTVRASDLYNAIPQPINQTQLDSYCGLGDNNTENPGHIIPVGGPLNDFTSEVYNSNTVTWIGVNSGSDGYRVLITGITNNSNFFDIEPHGGSGQFTATLKDDINGVGDTYTISFNIDAPGNPAQYPPKPYGLDPKLSGKAN